MTDLQSLRNTRKNLRRRVTELYTDRVNFDLLSPIEIKENVALLKGYREEILDLNSDIHDAILAKENDNVITEEEYVKCQEYKDRISKCMTRLREATGDDPPHNNEHSSRSMLRCPTAPLPSYASTEGEDLIRFFSEFEDTTKKYNYTQYDKLLLLKQQLSGRALTLVNSLESDKQGYTDAKCLLLKALASKDLLIFNTIKQFTELKLPSKSDPFEYISKVRLLSENVKRLDISVNSFLQYFVWFGLNEQFQEQLINITNQIRPSYDDIVSNFFIASERYSYVQKKISKTDRRTVENFAMVEELNPVPEISSTNMFASNVNYRRSNFDRNNNFRQCLLCPLPEKATPTHPIYRCDKYADAKSKIKRINELNGCVRCGYTNHIVAKCRYKFSSKCKHCEKWHQSYLCTAGDTPAKSGGKSRGSDSPVNNNTVVISDVFPGTMARDCILPTFSFTLNNCSVRGLKDCGSQGNFIAEDLADKLNLKIIDNNVDLNLNGINTLQHYRSKIVELDMGIGDSVHKIEAITIPNITVSMKISCLGDIVKVFQDNKLPLADSFLSPHENEINNLQFILGTKGAYCLPESDVVIGQDVKSVYSNTPSGILLRGDAAQLLSNISMHFHSNMKPLHSCASVCADNLKYSVPSQSNTFNVMSDGRIVASELEKATNQMLSQYCEYYTNYDQGSVDDVNSELNDSLVKFALDNLTITSDHRICMPLMWNNSNSHLLGSNRGLAEAILKSNMKKLRKDKTRLSLIDKTFREQEDAGIIERIDDFEQFTTDNPNHSFLAHMAVFKMKKTTTKCRVVYLSNLCQNNPTQNITVSHNQAIHSGPNLNQKLASAILHLRFDPLLLCFDIQKAFNCIGLNEADQSRLLLLWFRNVEKGDFTIVPYKHVRLSFGVRCSPTLLMLALYYMLVLNTHDDDREKRDMKSLIYQLSYMDNLAVTATSNGQLRSFYNSLAPIFEEFGFPLQQYITNDNELQNSIDDQFSEKTDETVKLLGLQWDRCRDTLSTNPIDLDIGASTKRAILSSIASQYDIYNFNGPLLNRARLFLHDLQCDQNTGWDDKLSNDALREWRNICRQANASPLIEIPRFVGLRNGSYKLIAFSDSSQTIYGIVVYILDIKTNQMSFIMAKNRIVNKQMENKSIPCLEMQGIVLATECLVDLRKELCGDHCMYPINITEMMVYSDSLVSLSWINAHVSKFDKLQKRSVFVQNRLIRIAKLCEEFPVTYNFVSGMENPADCITRCLSYKKLSRTSFISGPSFICSADSISRQDMLRVTVPNPGIKPEIPLQMLSTTIRSDDLNYSRNLNRFSDFSKLRGVYSKIMIFINKLKRKINHNDVKPIDYNFIKESTDFLLKQDQLINYADLVYYFESNSQLVKDIPNLVKQLNIYIDNRGLLRVKSKFGRMKDGRLAIFPVLLHKNSKLTELFIRYFHEKMFHAGLCNVLSNLRHLVWIPHCYSVVKRILKTCVICTRFKAHPIKLNQSPYRLNRIDPPQIPYRYVYVDFCGPYKVKQNGERAKVYILCITCMFTRAINLKVCIDLSVHEFLRGFQMHSFEFGVPISVISDLGCQLTSGANIIQKFLSDPDSIKYFEECKVSPIKFEQYPKGNSELGALVESCVKLTKRLMFGAIGNNVLQFRDFEFFVAQTVHLVNKRPIAFKNTLSDSSSEEFLNIITPENLLKGHNLISINLIPSLQPDIDENDPEWSSAAHVDCIRDMSKNLRRVRENLITRYHNEFLAKLIDQAVDVKDRYKPVKHCGLNVNDIVIIKEPNTKICNYPMGKVISITKNINGEVTEAEILKGSTREIVKRHSSVIIPLLTADPSDIDTATITADQRDAPGRNVVRPQRKAAARCRELLRQHS